MLLNFCNVPFGLRFYHASRPDAVFGKMEGRKACCHSSTASDFVPFQIYEFDDLVVVELADHGWREANFSEYSQVLSTPHVEKHITTGGRWTTVTGTFNGHKVCEKTEILKRGRVLPLSRTLMVDPAFVILNLVESLMMADGCLNITRNQQ